MTTKSKSSSNNLDSSISKSQRMRELYDEGKSIADIARELQTYYSFVHRVIKRYEAERNNPTPAHKSITQQIRDLCDESKTVDEIHEILKVDKARIYGTMKKYRQSKKKEA